MLSSYNNKMMLDLMFNNKKYIKYITEKSTDNFQTTRNNKDKNNTKKEFSINTLKINYRLNCWGVRVKRLII